MHDTNQEAGRLVDMDRHIQQTNDRLLCIKQHLQTPTAFQNSARELLEWCSDTRAFQPQFEDGLMGCLTVVSKVASQPGYDLELGYRLLAVCASHKDMFTSKSSGLLSTWCEELGRSLLLRHQKSRPVTSELSKSPPGNMHPQMQKAMPPGHPGADGGWGTNQGQAGHQSLSVVTTIWGVTPATQSGPFTHNPPGYPNTTMTGANTTHMGPQSGNYPAMQKGAGGGNYNPQGIPYRRDSHPSGYPPTPNTPGSNPPATTVPEYTPPTGALSAAAFVAAAATATATATATASMVALQEQQNQQQQMNMNMQMNMNQQYGPQMQMGPGQPPYGPQYGPGMPPTQRHPGPMPMSHGPGPMTGKAGMGPGPVGSMGMYPRRSAPYPPNPHQIMHKRQLQAFQTTQMEYGPGPGPAGYPNHQTYRSQYPPTQQPLPSPTYGMPHHQGMRPGGPGPGPYANGQTPYMMPGPYPPSRPPTQPGFYPSQQNNFQHSPISGNPTPPMTPGAGPPYTGDMKPAYPPDIKPPMIKRENDELRLTFPVRDGVVLPPFRLEHNLAVSNHVFHLRESVYQTLMWRSDLELQLKCFHHEDRQMNTNWPASVTVSVNATPLSIERGENKSSHKPLYLKEVCQGGRNTIQITVTACCCSHLFVLQLVHRPSIRSVLQGLLRKRLLPAEHCITKIKRNFSNVASNSAVNGDDGVEQTAIKVPLKCPITCRRISLPARGHDCKHIQCFDLESYLQLNCERGTWRCPVCNKTALLEGLEIDQYIWAILTNLSNTEFDEVTIDQAASWKPVPVKTIKQEEENDSCARWGKAMSPSSMQLPTMSNWDMGPQASPYSPMAGPPPQGDPMNPTMRHPDPNQQPPNHLTGRPPSLPGRMTPSGGPSTPQQLNGSHPLSHPPSSSAGNTNSGPGSVGGVGPIDCPNLPDLNFDPTAIINGEPNSNNLDQLLPENLGDPLELLSYLGPPDNNSGDANGSANGNTNNSGDDILAFFES